MKANWGLIFLGVCFVVGIAIMAHAVNLATAIRTYGAGEHTATVTGFGVKNLQANNAHFSASIEVEVPLGEEGYTKLRSDKAKVEAYLKKNGIEKFNWGELSKENVTVSKYSSEGNYLGQVQTGTKVLQSFSVNSTDVYKIQDLAIDITNLNAEGISLSVNRPTYTLSDDLIEPLKLDLIDVATDNALVRAKKLIVGFDSEFRAIKRIDVGQFRITPVNGEDYGEEYHIDKKVSVTVHAVYIIKD